MMIDRPQKLLDGLQEISEMDRTGLAQRWQQIYGSAAPKGSKRGLLERAVTWHLQAKYEGKLKPSISKALKTSIKRKPKANAKKTSIKLKPGARLVRDWHGVQETVEVSQDGFLWRGEVYKLLSAIARAITGTRWSGPRFFGV